MVFRKIEDETLLVPIRSNVGDLDNIYVLNDTGARIWELLDGKISAAGIRDIISTEYEATSEEAERDVKVFLENLESVGAIKRVL